MAQQPYVVREGDTLWDLAGKFLESPLEWSRLWAYNNRSSVVQVTGKGIKDPDLIYVGQKLLMPILPGDLPSEPPEDKSLKKNPPPRLKDKLKDTFIPFVFKYDLDDLPLIQSVGPGFSATIKLSGSVAIKLADKVPLASVTHKGLEMTYKSQTDGVLEQLLSETSVSWDKNTRRITYGCNMVSKSTTPFAPSTSIGIAISSNSPVPVIKGEIQYPSLTGTLNRHHYVAMDVKIVIEIAPEVPVDSPEPVIKKYHTPVSVHGSVPKPERKTNWVFIGGVVLIAGTIIADFLTVGASVADDPVTISIGLRMMGLLKKLTRVKKLAPRPIPVLSPVAAPASIVVVPVIPGTKPIKMKQE